MSHVTPRWHWQFYCHKSHRWYTSIYLDCQPLLPHLQGPILNIDMSDPPSGKPSKKYRLLRLLKDPFSRRNRTTFHHSDNATASISASPTDNATSASQVNLAGTEYTSILGLSTTPSAPLIFEQRMKEYGSTTYEGLKEIMRAIFDLSGSFPPLKTTAAVFLMISMAVDVSGSLCSTIL